jgi:hypothetical protein
MFVEYREFDEVEAPKPEVDEGENLCNELEFSSN